MIIFKFATVQRLTSERVSESQRYVVHLFLFVSTYTNRMNDRIEREFSHRQMKFVCEASKKLSTDTEYHWNFVIVSFSCLFISIQNFEF